MSSHRRVRITQRMMDDVNDDAAAEPFPIPPRIFDALFQAANTVEEGHRLHDVVSRMRAQESFLPFPRVPMRVIMSRAITVQPRNPEPESEPLVFEVTHVGEDKKLSGQDSCPICLVDYEHNDNGVVLPCQHGFHEQCIKEWTNNHPTCPICRLQLA